MPSHDFGWEKVAFRLTLCWLEQDVYALESEGPVVEEDAPSLCVEKFEVGGVSLAGPKHATINSDCTYGITFFFGDPPPETKVRDERVDLDFLKIEGIDLKSQFNNTGSGHGLKFGISDLVELSRRSGISVDKLKEAWGLLGLYRLAGGLLQRRVFMMSSGTYEYLTIVPQGDWRSIDHGASRVRMSLRRYVVSIFHSTALGPHRDRDRTITAIRDAGCWWPKMYADVSSYVRACLICSSAKDRPLVTGHQRSRDYDGPFRYLVIDYVGPMTPTSGKGNKYMFTCACAWSGWYWAIPCENNDSATAAYCLFHRVICDLAGYPACLGSDRDKAFTEGVVKNLVNYFGIANVVGTAYHPQSQSVVERPHREYNMLCKTFMSNFMNWDDLAYIFVWVIRTTCKLFNGNYTPYEIITGLKPRSPIDPLLAQPAGLTRVSVDDYVADLVTYLKKVHKYVDTRHREVREEYTKAKYREHGPDTNLAVGDYCLLQKAPELGVSKRFQSPTYDQVFQVVEVHGEGQDAKAYTLSDLSGNREDLGFTQPVAKTRLVPIELLPLAQITDDQPTRLLINDRGRDREATIVAQTADGKVYIRYEETDEEQCVDLASLRYQWL